MLLTGCRWADVVDDIYLPGKTRLIPYIYTPNVDSDGLGLTFPDEEGGAGPWAGGGTVDYPVPLEAIKHQLCDTLVEKCAAHEWTTLNGWPRQIAVPFEIASEAPKLDLTLNGKFLSWQFPDPTVPVLEAFDAGRICAEHGIHEQNTIQQVSDAAETAVGDWLTAQTLDAVGRVARTTVAGTSKTK